jgi:hypothetical protein
MAAVGFLFNFHTLKPFPVPDHRKLLLISVLVFTALLFIEHFVIRNLFSYVTPDILTIIAGFYLIVVIWVEFYVVFKRIVKQDENNKVSVPYLTAFGCLIVLFSSMIFQTYRQTEFSDVANEDRIRIFMMGCPVFTIVAGIFAFSVAVDVRVKKRWLTTLINIGIVLLFYFVGPYLISFIKGE